MSIQRRLIDVEMFAGIGHLLIPTFTVGSGVTTGVPGSSSSSSSAYPGSGHVFQGVP